MSAPVLLSVKVVERDMIAALYSMNRSDFDLHLSGPVGDIPQMPHRPGKPTKFHLDEFDAWYRRYLLIGGK